VNENNDIVHPEKQKLTSEDLVPIMNIITNEKFKSIKEACKTTDIKYQNFYAKLKRGSLKDFKIFKGGV
jgi:hypothetical protein